MKKVIVTTVVVLGVIVVALLGFATTKPDTFRIERTASIKATPERIFAHLNTFYNWRAWSPWEKLDSTMQRTYSGTGQGMGAVYEWKGNSEVGSGRMEITESSPFSKISIKLDFIEPFEGHNTTEFTLKPEGEATNVTWAMHGPNQFLGKVMSIFVDMDNMIGKDFEAGLASLKTSAESGLQDLIITRVFDAPRELVWKAWTEPERVKQWWGPKTYTAPACNIDLRTGGKYLKCMRSPEGLECWTTGVYREIVEPERIAYTNSFADEKGNVVPATHYGMSVDFPLEVEMTVTFDVQKGKAKITLHHAGVPAVMLELARAGWNESFDKLAESLKYN
jgi:uncharacterized protein YndB with AHSA1/START domain